jgi:pimeloyl-ACP methyl ester carboxylesterase
VTSHPIRIESAGGEYMESVVVLGWTVKPGDPVKAGQLVVTVETAKAATDVEAERDGWLEAIFFTEGQEAPVGTALGVISDAPIDAARRKDDDAREAGAAAVANAAIAAPRLETARVIASPYARRLAREVGLDLSGVTGTGPQGRVKQRDIAAALSNRSNQTAAIAQAPRARRDPIVLLHGFGADRSAWRHVLPLLPADVETITLDLPGHGDAARVAARSIEDLALDISDRLQSLGVERAHVVGHSLGGATALSVAAIGRVAIRSLTLLAPGGLGPEINADFLRGLAGATTPETLGEWLSVMVDDASVLPTGFAAAALRQIEKTGNRSALAALADRLFPRGSQGFDLTAILNAATVPTRILWGRSDRIIPPSHVARAPGFAAVHLLEGVGHVPHLEVPTLTARLVSETYFSAG